MTRFEHWKLLHGESKRPKPPDGVGHRLFRPLAGRGGRHHVCGSVLPGTRDEHPVLLLVARLELDSADQRNQARPRHLRSMWRCLTPLESGSAPAPPVSRTWGPRAPLSTTSSLHGSARALSPFASTTPTSSGTSPSTSS